VVACVPAYEEGQGTQTYSVYVVPAFWTDHRALGLSRRSHDSKQNLNRSVCLDLAQAVYLVGHRHRGLSHMASSVLLPVNNKHSNSHITFVETNYFKKTLHTYCRFWRCTLQKMVYMNNEGIKYT
jgi:hypothetical protein